MKTLITTNLKLLFVLLALSLTFSSCKKDDDNPLDPTDDKGAFTLSAKYKFIRSYPDGGGIFVISITTDSEFEGIVQLSVETDNDINAELNKSELTISDKIADVLINPSKNSSIDTHKIIVKAKHSGIEKRLELFVDVMQWEKEDPESVKQKRNEFKNFCISKNALYQEIFTDNYLCYETYPEILIVEHNTFITENYEVRLCYHVMIPPHDWSKLLIRKRNSLEPEIALMRETNGSIHEIPVGEYPTFFGY
jgi:hypothetical protein